MTTSNRKPIIDIKTPKKGYPLPNLKNPLQTDVQRIIKSFEKIDADIHELDSDKLDQTGGRISGNIGRTAHEKGCFVGGYNNLGNSSHYTNPIFAVGDHYLPNGKDLNNFYGIGFGSGVSSFIPYISYHSWGLYVAAEGVARVFLDGNKGNIYAEADAYVQGGKKKVATEEYADQKFLPLKGGTLKGDLKLNNNAIRFTGEKTDKAVIRHEHISGGASAFSFYLDDDYNDYFRWLKRLYNNNTTYEAMSLKSDGLRVDGKKVATEEYADQKFLPLEGGALTGDLKIITGEDKSASFQLLEKENYGFELVYAGGSNVTHFRTYDAKSEPVDFMTVARGSNKPDFKDIPTVDGKKVATEEYADQKFLPLDGGTLKGDLKLNNNAIRFTGEKTDKAFIRHEHISGGVSAFSFYLDDDYNDYFRWLKRLSTSNTAYEAMSLKNDGLRVDGKKVAMQSEIDALKKELAALKALITKG